jgi:hypothetical protein
MLPHLPSLPHRLGRLSSASYIIPDLRHHLPSLPDDPFLARLCRPPGDGPSPVEISLSVAVVASSVEAFDTSCFSIVGSIAGSTDAYLVTPKHWGIAMKSPFK